MEYLKEMRRNQRKTECLVLVLYTLLTINLSLTAGYHHWADWIIGVMLGCQMLSWGVFIGKYKTYRFRIYIATTAMMFSFILYATHTEDIYLAITTFMVLVIFVAFYGLPELLWVTVTALAIIVFYHVVVAKTPQFVNSELNQPLLLQAANLLWIEVVVGIWVVRRQENSEQMIEMIDALVDAEQSKDDFLANVSHEIRTPINTICGMSDMALREQELEKLRDEVYDIQASGRSLMSLVSDILDFSQLQSGKMDLEEEVYNISSTINDVINMSMAKKMEKNIELIVDCDARIPYSLRGDEKKIRRVIMNLVDNAIKFTNEGCVTILVEGRKESYGLNLAVTVKDTGIGINEENLEKIFHSFSQVDTKRNRQEGGIGLGLAISKALVQKMGGTITVKSRVGKGSVMKFVVPQKIVENVPIARLENREGVNIAIYTNMEPYRMEAIRDEYSNNIRHMMEQLQVRCHVCRNLAELKRRQDSEHFSHIFISLEEYQEDSAYFDELVKQTRVIVVLDRPREKYLTNYELLRLYKPFYIIPVVSILNGSRGSEGGLQMVRHNKFIAPSARILIVDDNLMNIRVVEGLLREYQIQVIHATSGAEALDLVESMDYDFVFMDHMMPEMDGIETMHRIRGKIGHYYQRVPIIALTANAAPGSREMFLKEGFADFVAKPVEVSVLERVLQRNLPESKIIYPLEEADTGGQKEDSATDAEGADTGSPAVLSWENISKNGNADTTSVDADEGKAGTDFAIGDLDIRSGLMYCGSRKAYLDILRACCDKAEEQHRLLAKLYADEDWTNYTVKVHALKSMMRSLGAVSLSEQAKALERAGKAGDISTIRHGQKPLMEEYRRVIEEIAASRTVYPDGYPGHFDWDAEPVPMRKNEDLQERKEDLAELSEQEFDARQRRMEEAMYALDAERMRETLDGLEQYQYQGMALKKDIQFIREKIDHSDLMSAGEAFAEIRNRTAGGGTHA